MLAPLNVEELYKGRTPLPRVTLLILFGFVNDVVFLKGVDNDVGLENSFGGWKLFKLDTPESWRRFLAHGLAPLLVQRLSGDVNRLPTCAVRKSNATEKAFLVLLRPATMTFLQTDNGLRVFDVVGQRKVGTANGMGTKFVNRDQGVGNFFEGAFGVGALLFVPLENIPPLQLNAHLFDVVFVGNDFGGVK